MPICSARALQPLRRNAALSRRAFISLPSSSVQHLTAHRTLPYTPSALYDLIADVDSYVDFVPYCSHSRVTAWTEPDALTGRRWPTRADLRVGWGGFEEVFTSRLRCVPERVVEAVSGGEGGKDASAVFKSLVTLWSLRPIQSDGLSRTEVHLSIKYQFVNPLYATVSSAVSEKVAGLMVEAFEKEARSKLQNLTG